MAYGFRRIRAGEDERAVLTMAAAKRYEIRVAGEIDRRASAALAGREIVSEGSVSVITADVDAAGLRALLAEIRRLEMELLEIRQLGRRR